MCRFVWEKYDFFWARANSRYGLDYGDLGEKKGDMNDMFFFSRVMMVWIFEFEICKARKFPFAWSSALFSWVLFGRCGILNHYEWDVIWSVDFRLDGVMIVFMSSIACMNCYGCCFSLVVGLLFIVWLGWYVMCLIGVMVFCWPMLGLGLEGRLSRKIFCHEFCHNQAGFCSMCRYVALPSN